MQSGILGNLLNSTALVAAGATRAVSYSMRWRRAGTAPNQTLDAGHGLLLDERRSTVAKHYANLSAFLEASFYHLF